MKNQDFHSEIIADSINEYGDRLTTFLITFPRMILAEFNTHRMLSRNSASSRAIPFGKMVKMVEKNPFIPMAWMRDHKGMQGNEYIEGDNKYSCVEHWLYARTEAVKRAKLLHAHGLTKQICNRLLEPFMWHTVIASGTDWGNFFALRAHPAAEIHMQKIAGMMLESYNASIPTLLEIGEWHIPFGDKIDGIRIQEEFDPVTSSRELESYKIKIATARCARLSYLNFEGKDDYQADIKLHDHLVEMGHWSPFEHCAEAIDYLGNEANFGAFTSNFTGFLQYRKLFDNENRNDPRISHKESPNDNH